MRDRRDDAMWRFADAERALLLARQYLIICESDLGEASGRVRLARNRISGIPVPIGSQQLRLVDGRYIAAGYGADDPEFS